MFESLPCHMYVQPAVNRQPGYRWGTRRASYSIDLLMFGDFLGDPEIASKMTNLVSLQRRVK